MGRGWKVLPVPTHKHLPVKPKVVSKVEPEKTTTFATTVEETMSAPETTPLELRPYVKSKL